MLARGGKAVAVLMSRKAISPSRRKMLTEYLDDGTPKFHKGICIFEEKAYTFVLETQAAGLAKKVKAALLKQVELRLKVRVRGEEGDLDDDGEPPEKDDDEDEGSEVQGEQRATIPEPPPLKETVSTDPLKADFDKRWPGVERQVLDTLQRGVGDVSKLRAVAEFVREKGEGGNYKAALQGIESLLKLLGSTGTAVPPAPPLPPTGTKPEAKTPEADAETQDFNKRLAALLPEVKTAVAQGGERGQDVKLKVSEVGVFARKKEFERAHALLDEAEELMAEIARDNEPEPDAEAPEDEDEDEQDNGEGSEEAQRFEQRLAEIEPDYLALLAARNPEASRLRAVLDYANGQAEAGDHAKALAALERLKGLMDEARGKSGGGGEPPAGIVAYRTSLLGLRQAVATVERQIAALVAAIPSQQPDEAELADDLAEALRDENAQLQDLVDEAMSASGDKAQPATRALRQRLEALIDEIQGNELIQHVDAPNSFGVKLSVGKTLGDALAKVRSTMPAVN